MMVPWHHWRSFACLHNDINDGGNADKGALALLVVLYLLTRQQHGGGGTDNGVLT
jgi:hypothetical protein